MLHAGEVAKEKNLKIATGLMCRHSVARQEFINQVREGELGDIQLIRAYRMGQGAHLGNRNAQAKENELDLVHLHYAIPHAASALLAHQALGDAAPRFVTTLHGTDITLLGDDPAYRAITRLTVAACDGLTAPSAFLRGETLRLLELPGETPIEVIPNFVDTAELRPVASRDEQRNLRAKHGLPTNGIIVGSSAALKRDHKRVDHLIREFAAAWQACPASAWWRRMFSIQQDWQPRSTSMVPSMQSPIWRRSHPASAPDVGPTREELHIYFQIQLTIQKLKQPWKIFLRDIQLTGVIQKIFT